MAIEMEMMVISNRDETPDAFLCEILLCTLYATDPTLKYLQFKTNVAG